MTTAKKGTTAKAGGSGATAKKRSAKGSAAGSKSAGKKTPAKGSAAGNETASKSVAKKTVAKKSAAKKTASLAKGKDPKGGLTAEGRRYFEEKEGLHLRPGVKGKADTPEKMVRKGSFLRRHFANPPGPVTDEKGAPTRQALQAAAWGEPVPKNEADERKLAEKGSALLEQYHAAKEGKTGDGKKATKKSAKTKA